MSDDLIVRVLDDADERLEARRLHARRYLDAGFVEDLNADGVIDDPYVEFADYFGVAQSDGRIVGVSRLIASSALGLPALTEFDITADARRRFDALDPSGVVELSALAVERGAAASRAGEVTKVLFRAMYQHSLLRAGHTHWLAAVDVRVARHLRRSYGFVFEQIGESRMYLGSETVPVVCDLVAQLRYYRTVDMRSGDYFCAGMVIDLVEGGARVAGSTGAHVPIRGRLPA